MKNMIAKLSKTALIGLFVSSVWGSAVFAANPLSVKLGGFFYQAFYGVDAGYIVNQAGQTYKEFDFGTSTFTQDAEIYFKGKAELDNGMIIGFDSQLELKTDNDQVDEHYLYVVAEWGKLVLGSENGASYLTQVQAPAFVPGFKLHNNKYGTWKELGIAVWKTDLDASTSGNQPGWETYQVDKNLYRLNALNSGDANKITYFTPRIEGFQFGFSFTPNNEDIGGGPGGLISDNVGDGKAKRIIELGLSYKGESMGVDYAFSLGWSSGESELTNAGTPTNVDPEETALGAKLGYGPVQVGATYVNRSNYENQKGTDLVNSSFSFAYTVSDKIKVGYAQLDSSIEAGNNSLMKFRVQQWGGGYTIKKGVGIGVTFEHTILEAGGTAREDDFIGVTLGLKL